MPIAPVAKQEAFKPIPVRARSDAPWLFLLRCAVDLQLLTIQRFLAPRLVGLRGKVLDVGAGEGPWRDLLTGAEYVGLDVGHADDFGMDRDPRIVYYDGRVFPFADASFDHLLCVEVIEHVEQPDAFVDEMARVLKPGGSLILTVPWSARLHHVPHDYRRYTRYGLRALLRADLFDELVIEARGSDVAVIANKLIVMALALAQARGMGCLWRWPMAVMIAPVAGAFLVAAHVALRIGLGSRDDPLGYGTVARRAA